jgi:hypothetical protein
VGLDAHRRKIMNSKKIRINCGPAGGDACSPYYITFPDGMTAREFIMEQLSDEREWGILHH